MRNAVRGQPGSPVLRLPIHDTILADHGLETSFPAIGFLSRHLPSPQNDESFYLRRPSPQHGSSSETKEHAKLRRIKQMTVGSLHVCRVHSGGSVFKKRLRRGGSGNLFFYHTKGLF